MKKYAVIDIGSNSVRLMFVASGKVLYKRLQTTRLGEGLAIEPILHVEAIQRSANAVAEFYAQAQAEGAEEIFAFATAAVRTAKNGKNFIDAVKELCGLDVEIVSGETEAEIGILGALGNEDGAVIDIGGASTEIVVRASNVHVYKKSVNMGVVRLKDSCGLNAELLAATANQTADAFGVVPTNWAYAIGGTATALGAWHKGLTTYDAEQVTGTKIFASEMRNIANTLLNMTPEEICSASCMPKGRADVIAGGAVLLATLMECLGIQGITVSDRDNLEGYAVKKGLDV